MSTHHEFSPSKYSAWAECPCFKQTNKESSDASEGTHIHSELEKALHDPSYVPDNPTSEWGADILRQMAGSAEIFPEMKLIGRLDELAGITGTADAMWLGEDDVDNIADMKSFSDGTTNHIPQLVGYAALHASENKLRRRVRLHVLHGATKTVETVEYYFGECVDMTVSLLKRVKSECNSPRICKWCKYCAVSTSCSATSNAIDVVGDTRVSFSKMSLCQKLVVCDAVSALIETIRDEAKKLAEESPDKAVEMDGIRYELKPWAGKSVCEDVCNLAYEIADPHLTRIARNGTSTEYACNGLSNDEMIKLCTVSKTAVIDALCKKNVGNPTFKKVDAERWVKGFFKPTVGAPHFVRTK